jgi:hypothetical protein
MRLEDDREPKHADAMTFLARYALGTFAAVMDYMDTVDGEPIPATA